MGNCQGLLGPPYDAGSSDRADSFGGDVHLGARNEEELHLCSRLVFTGVLLPLLGPLLFLLFGYQHVNRPLLRKRRHKQRFRGRPAARLDSPAEPAAKADVADVDSAGGRWEAMARLARNFGAYPVTTGNRITFYEAGQPAFDAMLQALRSARHHIHLEYFIFQPDAIGRSFLDVLAGKAREGVQVRLLYDAMGSYRLHRWRLWRLRRAGGKCSVFLPLSPLAPPDPDQYAGSPKDPCGRWPGRLHGRIEHWR